MEMIGQVSLGPGVIGNVFVKTTRVTVTPPATADTVPVPVTQTLLITTTATAIQKTIQNSVSTAIITRPTTISVLPSLSSSSRSGSSSSRASSSSGSSSSSHSSSMSSRVSSSSRLSSSSSASAAATTGLALPTAGLASDVQDNTNSGFSAGTIAGIAVGVVAGVILIGALLGLLLAAARRRRKQREQDSGFAAADFARQSVMLDAIEDRSDWGDYDNNSLQTGNFGNGSRTNLLGAAALGAGAGAAAGGMSRGQSQYGSRPPSMLQRHSTTIAAQPRSFGAADGYRPGSASSLTPYFAGAAGVAGGGAASRSLRRDSANPFGYADNAPPRQSVKPPSTIASSRRDEYPEGDDDEEDEQDDHTVTGGGEAPTHAEAEEAEEDPYDGMR